MPLTGFHPAVARWFERTLGTPSEPQVRGWPSIRAGRDTLIAAPTGSGKTLAAFLAAIDDLVRRGLDGTLPDETLVVYVSPLKALSNDIEKNLQIPLAGIRADLEAEGASPAEIRTFVRTGDTPAAKRTRMIERPPHLFVTTPESLYILLTSEGGRRMLKTARTVIVDEIHALVRDKRGSHLALSLERLDALAGRRLVRIGLSATQRPIEDVARFLTGGSGERECTIVDAGHARKIDLAIEVPGAPLEAVMSGETWEEIYDRIAALVKEHRSTLVFVNTRRLAERVTRHLSDRIGEEHVTSHHGSLAREMRLRSEQRLKSGDLRALVATSSLELGIDVGAVELVCQIGSTRGIATLLQRVGRSGHFKGGVPKGRLFPTSRDELVESAALLDAARRGELDRVSIPEAPLDILAQQIVAMVAAEEWGEDALYALVRRAYPYRNLDRARFDAVVQMLAEGFSTRRGRRSAHVHRDAVNGKLRGRRGARLVSITNGGAIPDTADYEVVLEPNSTFIGTINEDFAIESMAGDIFQLGNASWRILRVEPGRVRVEDARGQPPTLPFWLGEAPSRTAELSRAVSRLREEIDRRGPAAAEWLKSEVRIGDAAAEQIAEYLLIARTALGAMPTDQTLVVERFFDESGGMQLVMHSPFGSRLNRAWGLALRKRFCQRFNFELQAAATEDAIVLSLGPTHSFPLEDVFNYLRSGTVREVLVQALLDAPMFGTRWRWNATRALAVLRFRGGKKVPPRFQRMDADDLMTLLFPDQVACAENLPAGKLEIPDHPLVNQTIEDCLVEAMDIGALEALLASIERGEKVLVARDLTEPSPLSHEILNARPYAFLDDAPLEERRTQAVVSRRFLDAASASDLGALDAAAIERVREEAWPDPETPDEVHDALVLHGFITEQEARDWEAMLEDLVRERRATRVHTPRGRKLWVAAERLLQIGAVHEGAPLEPPIAPAPRARADAPDAALVEIVRGRLAAIGPTTAAALAETVDVTTGAIDAALGALESEGFVLRGRFTPKLPEDAPSEWCERRLLARIHRYTLDRLRREIEPVTAIDFYRFLLEWQHVTPEARGDGLESVSSALAILEGFESPAAAWESDILPARLSEYDPQWLDSLCVAGRVAWARFTPPATAPSEEGAARGPAGPVRSTPIAIVSRETLDAWTLSAARGTSDPGAGEARALGPNAAAVETFLAQRGASFFGEIVSGTRLLRTQVEEALAELVAAGLVTSDTFAGLRSLLVPADKRNAHPRRRRHGRHAAFGMEAAGRWSLVARAWPVPEGAEREGSDHVERIARVLLRRYGVIFRRVIERESLAPPWRDLARVLRRLEARGEVRGGRFVQRFTGEQFALPEAVGLLRAVRRKERAGTLVSLSAADPLNLVGILTPGRRVPAIRTNRILFKDGEPVAVREGREVHFLVEVDEAAHWSTQQALLRRAG